MSHRKWCKTCGKQRQLKYFLITAISCKSCLCMCQKEGCERYCRSRERRKRSPVKRETKRSRRSPTKPVTCSGDITLSRGHVVINYIYGQVSTITLWHVVINNIYGQVSTITLVHHTYLLLSLYVKLRIS